MLKKIDFLIKVLKGILIYKQYGMSYASVC